MEIHLTSEQEAHFSHMAAQEGKGADELAREVFSRGLAAKVKGRGAVARILELRRGNVLPDGVTIRNLIDEGMA